MTRTFASLWLTLLLSLALATGAVAQGMALAAPDRGPLQAVVICADGHEAVVLVDRDGRQVDPADRHALCPEIDCADCPRLPDALSSPDAFGVADRYARAQAGACFGGQRLVATPSPTPLARGPPEMAP